MRQKMQPSQLKVTVAAMSAPLRAMAAEKDPFPLSLLSTEKKRH